LPFFRLFKYSIFFIKHEITIKQGYAKLLCADFPYAQSIASRVVEKDILSTASFCGILHHIKYAS